MKTSVYTLISIETLHRVKEQTRNNNETKQNSYKPLPAYLYAF